MRKINHAVVRPKASLDLLSRREILGLLATDEKVLGVFRDCALAVMNTGSAQDDASEVLNEFSDFAIQVVPESRGIKLEVFNAPSSAFVDGKMIRGIQEHLFSALRDIVYTHYKSNHRDDGLHERGVAISDEVFRTLRNAGAVKSNQPPNLVVCWGGHSIDRLEYNYCKQVGYHLGLRSLDIATGCGTGAMKGPMKGAVIGHGKQQIRTGRYVGITEPGIIASESPNPTVNELVILPDIEKRLEAFVRLAHCIIVFPGGVGTLEEILYLLTLMIHPDNSEVPLKILFAAPEGREDYFQQIDQFIKNTIGEKATNYYEIVVGKPLRVAQLARKGVEELLRCRRARDESFSYNWKLHIPFELQKPFEPTHESMSQLRLIHEQPPVELATQLRCAFSGIVAGNVKASGIAQVQRHGPFQLHGDTDIIEALGLLLRNFVRDGRMKLDGEGYRPCYEINPGKINE
ncbi:MAG: putative Rossmann-fold nucleotide-binding protein [Halieaceae bacterium]|jgi:predicted Rossmann-fold nucleotide-binding protein